MSFRFISFILLLLVQIGFTQEIDQYIDQIENGEIESVRKLLPELQKKYGHTSRIIYLSGLTHVDGDSAFKIFKKLVTKHSKFEYTENASSKMGQYFYSLGLYSQAFEHNKNFIFTYPNSKDLSRITGMMIRSMDAIGELDKAQEIMNKFVKKYSQIKFLKNEIGYIPPSIKGIKFNTIEKEKFDSHLKQIPIRKGNWCIQVGAFGVKSNAEKLREKLLKKGSSAYIIVLYSKKGKLFGVRVGPFLTKKTSMEKAEKLKSQFGLSYQILKEY